MAHLLTKYDFNNPGQGNARVVEGSFLDIRDDPPADYLTNPVGYYTADESKERWLTDPAQTAEELDRRNRGNNHTEFNDDAARPFVVIKLAGFTAAQLSELRSSNVLTRPPQLAHPVYGDEPELEDPDGVEQVRIIDGPISAPGVPGDDRVYWPPGVRYLDRNEVPRFKIRLRNLSTGRLSALTRDGAIDLTLAQLQALTTDGYTGETFTPGT